MDHAPANYAHFASDLKPCPMAMVMTVAGLGSIRRSWRKALVGGSAKATKHGRNDPGSGAH